MVWRESRRDASLGFNWKIGFTKETIILLRGHVSFVSYCFVFYRILTMASNDMAVSQTLRLLIYLFTRQIRRSRRSSWLNLENQHNAASGSATGSWKTNNKTLWYLPMSSHGYPAHCNYLMLRRLTCKS